MCNTVEHDTRTCLTDSVKTRYSYAVGVYGTVVVRLSSVCLSVNHGCIVPKRLVVGENCLHP